MLQRPTAQSESPLVSFSAHPTLSLIVCFFFFPPTVSHRYKHRECRAGDKEVWEQGRGRTTTGSVVQRGFSQSSIFFPRCYLPHFFVHRSISNAQLYYILYPTNTIFFQQGTVTSCDYWKSLGKFC